MPEILVPNWVARAAGELPPNPPLNPPPMPDYGQQAAAAPPIPHEVFYGGPIGQPAAVGGELPRRQDIINGIERYTFNGADTDSADNRAVTQRVTYLSDKEIAEFRLAALREAINACDIFNTDPIAKAIQFSKFIFEGK